MVGEPTDKITIEFNRNSFGMNVILGPSSLDVVQAMLAQAKREVDFMQTRARAARLAQEAADQMQTEAIARSIKNAT